MTDWTFERDLDDILAMTDGLWPQLQDAHLFLTGGTGFIGTWLLESLRHAITRHHLSTRVTVLTRDPAAFMRKAPHLAHYPAFCFLQGEVGTCPDPGPITHLIHAATEASADLNERDPLRMFDTIVTGTRAVLDLARARPGVRVLMLSSGAVYGQQPWDLAGVPETYNGGPDPTNPRLTYGEGKRAAEMLGAIYGKQFGVSVVMARIFTLLGPGLVLGAHFAAGNFIQDAMQGKPIVVNGNGLPCRSYLYTSDLTAWLWHLLLRGQAGRAYNVGSDQSVSIKELAERVACVVGDGRFEVLGAADAGWNPGRYVPSIARIREELGLVPTVGLDEAIARTALWNGWKGKS